MRPEHPSVRRIVLVLAVAMAGLSAGCATRASKAGGYYLDDGPGKVDSRKLARLMKAPDPVPVPEKLRARANRPYTVMGQHFVPMTERRPYRQQGVASWYGQRFHGKPTAIGETYDMYGMTAAHPTLPLPSYVRVRNLENGRSVVVRVNDRGPFLRGRLIDLSFLAASKLDYVKKGHARVEVELLDPAAGGRSPLRQVARGQVEGAAGRSGTSSPEGSKEDSKRLQTSAGKRLPADTAGMTAPAGGRAPATGQPASVGRGADAGSGAGAGVAGAVGAGAGAGEAGSPPAMVPAARAPGDDFAPIGRPDGAPAPAVRFGPARQRTVNGHVVFEGWGAEREEPEAVRRIDLAGDAAGGDATADRVQPGASSGADAARPDEAGRVSAGNAPAGTGKAGGRHAGKGSGQTDARPAMPPEGRPAAGWYLQLGVFRQMENALRVQREQQANGQADDPPVEVAQRNDHYVIQLGPYVSEADARASAAVIAGRTGLRPPIRKR